MANHSENPAKSKTSEFDRFKDFMQRLVAVPHSEVKARLDAEKKARVNSKPSSSRASRDKG